MQESRSVRRSDAPEPQRLAAAVGEPRADAPVLHSPAPFAYAGEAPLEN